VKEFFSSLNLLAHKTIPTQSSSSSSSTNTSKQKI
jgi:hypothetical protein